MTGFALTAKDGVLIEGHRYSARHGGDPLEVAFVIAHGFTGHHLKPDVIKVTEGLRSYAGVLTPTFRGHGKSGGAATFGIDELEDLSAVIRYTRDLGYRKVVTIGWSMGSGNVLLQAAEVQSGQGAADAVVSVSGAGRWYLRDTKAMRRVQWLIGSRSGRTFARVALRTRISREGWGPQYIDAPAQPHEAIAQIAPRPVLVVHGDEDAYFTVEQANVLFDAACEPKGLWIVDGFGHAESAADERVMRGIGERARVMVGLDPVNH